MVIPLVEYNETVPDHHESTKLVGGLEHGFYFSIDWEFHNPN